MPREERIALKTTKITGHIEALEAALLDPSLPSDQERAMTWRLEKLKLKLEKFNAMKKAVEGQGEAQGEEEEPWRHWRRGPGCHGGPCGEGQVPDGEAAPRWGHCGRGRGGKCRRNRLDGQQPQATGSETVGEGEDHPCGKKWVVPKETWAQFHEAKENLKAARRSGDAEAIKVAFEAFLEMKKVKKEARYPKA